MTRMNQSRNGIIRAINAEEGLSEANENNAQKTFECKSLYRCVCFIALNKNFVAIENQRLGLGITPRMNTNLKQLKIKDLALE
jgi:hypothetical protein